MERLNAFQPQSLNTYPTIASARRGGAPGRLRIAPELISTSSELLTPEMAERIEEAWGVGPFNLFASTEGLWGADCDRARRHPPVRGHDARRERRRDGRGGGGREPGARLLITNLFNYTQPLIRLELADAVTLTSEPCACGRPLRRMRTIAGRSDDVLTSAVCACTRCSSRSSRATGTSSSSRSCRPARRAAGARRRARRRRRGARARGLEGGCASWAFPGRAWRSSASGARSSGVRQTPIDRCP